ncbi:MAG: FAD-binding oxidoreductase [Gemmatimonadetes bacterium]|nr:FAD-binding oxidoreductase [Gemmatimonadota bacterium]
MYLSLVTANLPLWDDGAWRPLPRLEGTLTADVCVIGLGGSGLSCIDELRAMGRSVVGLDAVDVAAGAAGRNGGLLLPGTADYHHDAVRLLGRERALRLHQLTLEEVARIDAQAPGTVRFPGSVRLSSPDEDADCDAQFAAMRADGLPVERYEGPFGLGLFFPGDASFNPLRRCRALAARVQAAGARLFGASPAVRIAAGTVATPAGAVHADRVIVAVDGRLELLLPELLGVVRTARLQMLGTAPTREIDIPCPMSARWGFDYWQQAPDGSIALGGGRDIVMDQEWTAGGEPTGLVQAHLDSVLRDRLGVRAPVSHRWAANVSYTETGLPVLTEVRPGVWAIGGYSGTGNAIGALCGRAVARVACGEPSEFAGLMTTTRS